MGRAAVLLIALVTGALFGLLATPSELIVGTGTGWPCCSCSSRHLKAETVFLEDSNVDVARTVWGTAVHPLWMIVSSMYVFWHASRESMLAGAGAVVFLVGTLSSIAYSVFHAFALLYARAEDHCCPCTASAALLTMSSVRAEAFFWLALGLATLAPLASLCHYYYAQSRAEAGEADVETSSGRGGGGPAPNDWAAAIQYPCGESTAAAARARAASPDASTQVPHPARNPAWQDAERVFRALDADESTDRIDFHELMRLMRSGRPTAEGQALFATSLVLFTALDRNGDGMLSKSEVREGLAAALKSQQSNFVGTHPGARRYAGGEPLREMQGSEQVQQMRQYEEDQVQLQPLPAPRRWEPSTASREPTPPSSRSEGSQIFDAFCCDGVVYGTNKYGSMVAATFGDDVSSAAPSVDHVSTVSSRDASQASIRMTSKTATEEEEYEYEDGERLLRMARMSFTPQPHPSFGDGDSDRNDDGGMLYRSSPPPIPHSSHEPIRATANNHGNSRGPDCGSAASTRDCSATPTVAHKLTPHPSPGSPSNGVGAQQQQQQRRRPSPANEAGVHELGEPQRSPPDRTAPRHLIIFRNQVRSRPNGSIDRAPPPLPHEIYFYLRTRTSGVRFPFPARIDERAILHVARPVESPDGARGAPVDSEPQAVVALDAQSVVGLAHGHGASLPALFITVPSGWSPQLQRHVNRDIEPTELFVNLSEPQAHRGERFDVRGTRRPPCTVVHVKTLPRAHATLPPPRDRDRSMDRRGLTRPIHLEGLAYNPNSMPNRGPRPDL